ncbi:hypothetical protein AB0H83_31835 [Dactylosporangium sp. NPDC050688]|uniref:hypothetical protein n=1 Tax=Dactylosporangium sp. NPDC050688 TaxID=3157217 RepID=UPI0033F7813B
MLWEQRRVARHGEQNLLDRHNTQGALFQSRIRSPIIVIEHPPPNNPNPEPTHHRRAQSSAGHKGLVETIIGYLSAQRHERARDQL